MPCNSSEFSNSYDGAAGFLDIQHIGSTAVVGVWPKPIIDIIGGMTVYPANSELIEILEEKGYEYLGESGVGVIKSETPNQSSP